MEHELTPAVLLRRCLATDPIGMEFAILDEKDEATRNQLKAIVMKTGADIATALAEGYLAAGRIYENR